MATLQRIRNHSALLLIIVGVAMASFIVGDLLTSSSSILQSSRDKVVTVNGKKVTYEEFEMARNSMAELQKTLFGQSDNTSEASQRISQQVYNDFVTSMLMAEVSEGTGLSVTDAEFNELIQGDHISPLLRQIFTNPSNGQYMKEAVDFWIDLVINNSFEEKAELYRQAGGALPEWATKSNWMVLENQIKQERLMNKYNGLLSVAVSPNKLEAENEFAGNNTECTFAYVKQSIYTVGDSLVKVNSNDITKRYNATKYNYKHDASRNISYIAVPLRPSEADFEAALEELEGVKEEFSNNDDIEDLVNSGSSTPYIDAYVAVRDLDADMQAFIQQNDVNAVMDPTREGTIYSMMRIMGKKNAPDSLNVSVIVVSDKAKADSIERVLNAPHANFAEVATATCENPQLAAKGGEFGWINEIVALQAFGKEAAGQFFTAKVGKVFRTEISGMGGTTYLLAKVNEATAPVAKAKIAVYALDVTPSSSTRRDEYGKLNNFLIANKTIKAMQDSAASAGYRMLNTQLAATSYTIGSIGDARQAVRFAFQNKIGQISEIFECDDNLLVVAVTGATEAGYQTPKDSILYKRIETSLKSEAKSQKLVNDLKATADKTLADYATAMNSKIDTAKHVNFNLATQILGLGTEPEVVAAALAAEPNTVVGPIAGKSGAVVLSLVEKQEKGLAYNEEATKKAIASSREYMIIQNPVYILAKYADVEDNRISFY